MPDTKQVIVMRTDLNMRKGKMVAQGAHSAMAWITSRLHGQLYISNVEWEWLDHSFTKVCVGVSSEAELHQVYEDALDRGLTAHLIQDSGLTEFGGVPTYTCCAIGPDYNQRIDDVTGHLRLL